MLSRFEHKKLRPLTVVSQSYFFCLQVGEDIITPDTIDATHAAPNLHRPVEFKVPVGPIFNFVSGNVAGESLDEDKHSDNPGLSGLSDENINRC